MNRILIAITTVFVVVLLQDSPVQASDLQSQQAAVARIWCADYRASTKGNKCFLVKHPGKCPKGYRLGELFKYSRKYGYRTCIRGSKIHNVGKAVDRTAKKGVGASTRVIDKGARTGKKAANKTGAWVRKTGKSGVSTGKKAVRKTGGFIEKMGKKIQGWF